MLIQALVRSGSAYTSANITQETVTTNSFATSTTQTNPITYDTAVNPFYGVYVIPGYYGGTTNLNTTSPNNQTSYGGVKFQYEYNAANLPTVRYTITDKIAETLRYTYEAY